MKKYPQGVMTTKPHAVSPHEEINFVHRKKGNDKYKCHQTKEGIKGYSEIMSLIKCELNHMSRQPIT